MIIINILKHKAKVGFKHTHIYSFQHLGMGSLQRLETLRALGELTKRRRLRFLMYPQRHGFCSFSFAQHNAEGWEDDVIADAHGLSCIGEHVTASAAGTRITTRKIAARATMETHLALIISMFLLLLLLMFGFSESLWKCVLVFVVFYLCISFLIARESELKLFFVTLFYFIIVLG